MGDLDVNVGLLPCLRLVPLKLQVTLDSFGVEAHPALKLVVCAHVCCFCNVQMGMDSDQSGCVCEVGTIVTV